jgi:hypothetical protein
VEVANPHERQPALQQTRNQQCRVTPNPAERHALANIEQNDGSCEVHRELHCADRQLFDLQQLQHVATGAEKRARREVTKQAR